ncbi:hypothetical protein L1887_04837 [Cichorium endivia]|nr:hypothetical protein L1887_04837 [Cichorium endivia]
MLLVISLVTQKSSFGLMRLLVCIWKHISGVLRLDFRLISNLVVVIISATCGGIAFLYAGQPDLLLGLVGWM